MKLDRNHNTLIVLIVALGIGWYVGSSASRRPAPDRPVMRWLASAAKSLLWIALVAEDPPADRQAAIQATVGSDGYVKVDHGRGW